jgi:hypothetical protein
VTPAKQKDAGSLEGGLRCEKTIADLCASDASLPCQWPADINEFCPLPNSYGAPSLVGQKCTSFRYIREATSADIGFDAYYDLETGKLVAVVSHYYSTLVTRCNAGPPSFVEPRASPDSIVAPCESFVSLTCSDGGSEAHADATPDAARH